LCVPIVQKWLKKNKLSLNPITNSKKKGGDERNVERVCKYGISNCCVNDAVVDRFYVAEQVEEIFDQKKKIK